MARLFVVDPDAGTRVPFLRGILTRSLQHAGLPFDDAYRVASDVRDRLEDREEITTKQLEKAVRKRLLRFDPEIAAEYEAPKRRSQIVEIRYPDGQETPHSRWRHNQELQACGVGPEKAARIADRIHAELLGAGSGIVDFHALRRLTYRTLREELGDKAAHRYSVWQEFRDSERPLVIFLAGAVGSGKSTMAAELAHQLDILRVQPTDMLREVMRVMLPPSLLPALHTSTFDAWRALPEPWADLGHGPRPRVLDGYRAQAELVWSAVNAVVLRAVTERVSIILEGAHLHPARIADLEPIGDEIVVPIVLTVLDPKELKRRLKGRGKRIPDRVASRYLEHFPAISQIQDMMLDEADSMGVPIVPNEDEERTLGDLLGEILRVLRRSFDGLAESEL